MIFDNLLKNPEEILDRFRKSINRKERLLLTYLNQHCFNLYCENKDYKRLIDTKFEAYQADLGIFLAFKLLEIGKLKRIDATAMNNLIMNEIIGKNIPITIVGGCFNQDFVNDQAKEKGINLISYSNGFFNETEGEKLINHLNSLDCQVHIIAMGVPRQELFAERLSNILGSKVIICVGNFLEFYFGTKKRAPVFFQKIGIEWIFRLATEPRRLWKRYLIGIPQFLYRVLKIKFSSSHSL